MKLRDCGSNNFLSVLFFGVFLSLSPEVGYANSLLDTAKLVLDRSPDLQIVRTELELARAAAKRIRSKYLPRLSGKLEIGANKEEYQDTSDNYGDLTTGLDLSQDIINLQILYEIRGAGLRIKSAETRIRQVEQQVLHEFALAWASYWKARRQFETGKENVVILDKYRENARFRYDAGELTVTDVRLAETRYQGALSQNARFLREKKRARAVLKEIIKMPVPEDVVLFGADLEEEKLPGAEAALELHPSLLPLITESAALEQDIKQQKAGHFPTLELVSSVDYQVEGEFRSSRYPYTEGRVGLELNLPIYSGGSVIHATKEAVWKKNRQDLRIRQIRDELFRDIHSDRFDLDQSRAEIDIARLQLAYARETLAGMNEEYQMGTRTSTDVFLAQADMINSKLALISAREQHARFLMNYLFSLGRLDLAVLENLIQVTS